MVFVLIMIYQVIQRRCFCRPIKKNSDFQIVFIEAMIFERTRGCKDTCLGFIELFYLKSQPLLRQGKHRVRTNIIMDDHVILSI